MLLLYTYTKVILDFCGLSSVLVWQTTSFFILPCLVKAHIILIFRDLKAGRCCVNQPILFSAKKQIVTFPLAIPTFISTTSE